jgi:hypothetical protein
MLADKGTIRRGPEAVVIKNLWKRCDKSESWPGAPPGAAKESR